jgi:hypothetical protein
MASGAVELQETPIAATPIAISSGGRIIPWRTRSK